MHLRVFRSNIRNTLFEHRTETKPFYSHTFKSRIEFPLLRFLCNLIGGKNELDSNYSDIIYSGILIFLNFYLIGLWIETPLSSNLIAFSRGKREKTTLRSMIRKFPLFVVI